MEGMSRRDVAAGGPEQRMGTATMVSLLIIIIAAIIVLRARE
jgi:hypothetical protein